MQNTKNARGATEAPLARYIALLLLTTAGCILSGILWVVPNGLMAGAMAFCYSLGTIWLAELERRKPGSVGLPEALIAGLVSGMVAVLPVALLETIRPLPRGVESDAFLSPEMATWYYVTGPILFGIVMHLSYGLRRSARRPRSKVVAIAILLAGVVRLVLALTDEAVRGTPMSFSEVVKMLPYSPLMLLFVVIPFPLLWVLLTSWLDPAWKAGDRIGSKFVSVAQPVQPGDHVNQ